MKEIVEIVVILVVVGAIFVRRMGGEPVQGRRLLVLPAILIVVGLFSLQDMTFGHSTIVVAASVVFTGVMGAARGASIAVFGRDNVVHMRYTATTVGLWVITVIGRIGFGLLTGVLDHHGDSSGSTGLLLGIGVSLLCEGLVVLRKSVRQNEKIVWRTGSDGAPHTFSPWLDSLQSSRRRR